MYTVTQVKAKQSFQGASGRAEGSRAQSRAPGWAVGTVTTHRGAGVTTHRGVGVTTNRGAGQDHPQGRGAETTHRSASRDQRPPVAVLGHRNGNAWLWMDGSSGSNSKNEVESLTPCTSVCGCIWTQGPWQKTLGKMRSREHRRAPIRCDWCPAKSWQGLETGEP